MAALNEDKEGGVRRVAAGALAQIGDVRAVPTLMCALQDDKDVSVRRAAAEALAQIGDWQAVPALVRALWDRELQIRTIAARGLGNLGWEPDDVDNGARYYALTGQWEKCVEIGAPAVEPLSISLQMETGENRRAIVKALQEIGDPRAVRPLGRVLRDEDKRVRTAILAALEQFCTEQTFETLKNLEKQRSQAVARRDSLRKDKEQLEWHSLGYDGSGATVVNQEIRAVEEQIYEVNQEISAIEAEINALGL